MPSIRLTPQGAAQLEAELAHLTQVRRRELAERVEQERDQTHGDFADSRTYDDAKTESLWVEGRIAELERLLAHVELMPESREPRGEVELGAHVAARNGEGDTETYLIVDPAEADPRQGRISEMSPVGRALLGHRPGDEVGVETPDGIRQLTILDVR
jgi:transcription elongation factor GreA